MKKLLRKDLSKRSSVMPHEKKLFVLKNIKNNYNFSISFKKKVSFNLSKAFKNNTLNQLTNRCIMTGRKKRLNKLFSFSRICFLRLVRTGYLFGLRKSSW